MDKKTITIIGTVCVLVGFVCGLFFSLQQKTEVVREVVQGVSTAGTVNRSPVLLSSTLNLSGTSGTSTQIQNNSGYDLAVTSSFAFCTGAGTSYTWPNSAATGLTNLLMQMATTSATGLGLQGNINYIGNLVVPTTTVSGIGYVPSSTEPVTYTGTRVIPSGAYLSITSNATNTATCSVGVNAVRL